MSESTGVASASSGQVVQETPRNPFAEAPNSKKLFVLLAVFIGVCANIMVSTTNSTVLVAAANDIGGMEIYPFVNSIAGILGVCIMPVYGFLSSKNPASRRTIVTVSIVVGAITLVLRGLAPSMPVMIACNFFWGMLSAGIFVVGYTMIRDMYEKHQTAMFLGWIGTAMGLAKMVGPIIAGALIDNVAGGWRVYHFILAAVLAIAAICAWNGVKVSKEEVAHMARGSAKLDVAGCIATILFLGTLLTVLSLTSVFPVGSMQFWIMLLVSLVSLIWLALDIRSKGDRALFPKSLIQDKNTVLLSLMNLFANLSATGILFFVPAYIMRVLTNDPLVLSIGAGLAAGLATTFIGLCGAIVSPVYGKIAAKSGSVRTVCIIGVIARVIVIGGLLLFVGPECPVWIILALMFIGGLYNGQNMMAASTGAQIQVKSSLRAMSNSLIQLGQNVGSGLAIAVFTFLTATMGFEGGFVAALWFSLICTAFMLVVVLPLKKLEGDEDAK